MNDKQTLLVAFLIFGIVIGAGGMILFQSINSYFSTLNNLDTPEKVLGSYLDRQNYVTSPSGLVFSYCNYDAKYIQTCVPTFTDRGFMGYVGTVEIFSNCKDPYDWLTCESSTLNFTKNLSDACEQLMPFNTFDIQPKCVAKEQHDSDKPSGSNGTKIEWSMDFNTNEDAIGVLGTLEIKCLDGKFLKVLRKDGMMRVMIDANTTTTYLDSLCTETNPIISNQAEGLEIPPINKDRCLELDFIWNEDKQSCYFYFEETGTSNQQLGVDLGSTADNDVVKMNCYINSSDFDSIPCGEYNKKMNEYFGYVTPLQYGFIFSDWKDMKDVPDAQRNELCGEHELLDSTYLHPPFATKYRCISIGLISTSQSNMNGDDK